MLLRTSSFLRLIRQPHISWLENQVCSFWILTQFNVRLVEKKSTWKQLLQNGRLNRRKNQYFSCHPLLSLCLPFIWYYNCFFLLQKIYAEIELQNKRYNRNMWSTNKSLSFYLTRVSASFSLTKQFIEQNADIIFQELNKKIEQWRTKGVFLAPYKSKYNFQSLLLAYKTQGFNEIFEMNRKLPEVLKLFVYGSKDTVFEPKNIDQKVVFFTYKTQKALKQEYLNPLKQKYQQLHKQNAVNIQQKFIFKLQNGKHSLHMQKQFVPVIQDIINDYLKLII